MPKRKPRKGEYVCTCSAYRFKHRFGGGRCTGFHIVEETYSNFASCHECNMLDCGSCQVINGQDKVYMCPAWQEFVMYEGIKLLGRLKEGKNYL